MGFLDKLKGKGKKAASNLFEKASDAPLTGNPSKDSPLAVDTSSKKTVAQKEKLNKKLAKEQEKDAKRKAKEEKKKEKQLLKEKKNNTKKQSSEKKQKIGFFSVFTKSKKEKLLEEELKDSELDSDDELIQEEVNVFDSIEEDFAKEIETIDESLDQSAEDEQGVFLTKEKDSKTIKPVENITVNSDNTDKTFQDVEDIQSEGSIKVDQSQDSSKSSELIDIQKDSSDTHANISSVQISNDVNQEQSVSSDDHSFTEPVPMPQNVATNQNQINQELSDVESDLGELSVSQEDVKTAVDKGSLIKKGSLLSQLDDLITKRHYADEEKRKQKQMKMFMGYQRTDDGSHIIIDESEFKSE